MGYFDYNSPGNTALQGRWRVGQYDAGGEKKYVWDYKNQSSPYDIFLRKKVPNIEKWRSNDVRLLEDEKTALVWDTEYLGAGKYQQEWVFPAKDAKEKKVVIRTRIGNNNGKVTKYKDGEPAPPNARFRDVKYDADKRIFVMDGESNWLQQLEARDFKLPWWQDDGCNYSMVDLPDEVSSEQRVQLHFIYHENGDKEFYTTRKDGSLYLWGLQEVDKTKYTYKYDQKIMTPVQLAEFCDREVPYFKYDGGFPFTFGDESLRAGLKIFRNEGSETYRIFRSQPYYEGSSAIQTYHAYTLRPGTYVEFVSRQNEKISIIDNREEIQYSDRYEACIGVEKTSGTRFYTFGKGFVRETIETDPISARETCTDYITGERYPGRQAEVLFVNEGSIPLEIYRLNSTGNKIDRSGKERVKSDKDDPNRDSTWYDGMQSITVLEPKSSYLLKTRIGYAFKAIKRGNRRIERQWSEYHRRNMDLHVGESEICYGRVKIANVSEKITFSDDPSEEEFKILKEERRKKRQEDKRIASHLGLVSDANSAPNTVLESAAAGTPVGITALAIDEDEKDTVSYSVSHPFQVDASTGVVAVGQPLDREEHETHTIKVTATSSDGAISEAEFTVNVEDADEFDVGPVSTSSQGWERTSEISSRSIWLDDNHLISEGDAVGTTVVLRAFAEDKGCHRHCAIQLVR